MSDEKAMDGMEFDPFAEPPKWPKVVGILSICWGVLGLTCGGLGFASMFFFRDMVAGQLGDGTPLPPNMTPSTLMNVQAGLGFLLTVVLIVAGVMLTMRQWMGRSLHLLYAWVSVPLGLLGIYIQLQVQQDLAVWVKDYPDNPIAQGHSPIGNLIGLVVMVVLGMAWPVFCLVWFHGAKRTREAMTGGIETPAA